MRIGDGADGTRRGGVGVAAEPLEDPDVGDGIGEWPGGEQLVAIVIPAARRTMSAAPSVPKSTAAAPPDRPDGRAAAAPSLAADC